MTSMKRNCRCTIVHRLINDFLGHDSFPADTYRRLRQGPILCHKSNILRRVGLCLVEVAMCGGVSAEIASHTFACLASESGLNFSAT